MPFVKLFKYFQIELVVIIKPLIILDFKILKVLPHPLRLFLFEQKNLLPLFIVLLYIFSS